MLIDILARLQRLTFCWTPCIALNRNEYKIREIGTLVAIDLSV